MRTSARMALSTDFLSAFAKLPARQQRDVRSLITRFERDPTSPGLNYEKINNARNERFRALRVGLDYRAIVLKPRRGLTHVLLWVDKHDDAFTWAENHDCSINPVTGGLQVYVPEAVSTTEDQKEPIPENGGERPFARLKHRQLVRLGVPREMTVEVHALRDDEELEELKRRLPNEAYESLFYFLAGDSYESLVQRIEIPKEPVDTDDIATALKRKDSRSRFALIHEQSELEAMLDAPLEKWRVFLHPSQRSMVNRDWNGPVRLLGAAGTGKTVAAMHRARWLAAQPTGQKILFVTFTKNLTADIENNLRMICSPAEMKRIEVRNLDSWVYRFLKRNAYGFQICYSSDPKSKEAWKEALKLRSLELDFPEGFYKSEWRDVIQANAVSSLDEYKRVSRIGRGTPLRRQDRIKVWTVFESFRSELARRGLKDVDDAFRDAASLIKTSARDLGYSAIIVDEAQDLGPAAFRLIRSIVPEGKNDLFITGDAHQRIYGRKAILGRCGINIRGRSRKLLLNYRTTEETRAWSTRLLEGRDFDDLDGGLDDNAGVRSLTKGPRPQVRVFETDRHQAEAISRYLNSLRADGEPVENVCVVCRWPRERDAIRRFLERSHAVVTLVHKVDDRSVKGVRLATMHRVKGLEFERVILASVNAEHFEQRAARSRSYSETLDRSLLYVAASRAKKEVLVLSYGVPSRLIP